MALFNHRIRELEATVDDLQGRVDRVWEAITDLERKVERIEDFNKEMCLISISKSEVKKLIKDIENYLNVELNHVDEYDYYAPKRKSK